MVTYELLSSKGTEKGREIFHLGVMAMLGVLSSAVLPSLQLNWRVALISSCIFFSGYRRQLDVHWQVENRIVGNGWQVFCLSIDLCLCKEHSDLTSKAAYDWWIGKARDGYVIGAGGGPPCETYSAARLLPGGPPPVRTHDDEWGLQKLTRKQPRQVAIGTQLIQFLISFLIDLIPLGLCGFMEHPAYPSWAWLRRPASIWSNETVKKLAKLRCFSMVTFDQCTVGAKVRKPTGLLLLRMPSIRHALRAHGDQGRCNHAPGSHPKLQGRDCHGQFKTSWAKVYPAGFNCILADGICEFAKELREGADLDIYIYICKYRYRYVHMYISPVYKYTGYSR